MFANSDASAQAQASRQLAEQIIRLSPDRLRITVKGLRGSPERARAIEGALSRLPALHQVQASAITGRVLVVYEPAQTDVHQICCQLLQAFDSPPNARSVQPAATSLQGSVVRAIGGGLVVAAMTLARLFGGAPVVAGLMPFPLSLVAVVAVGYPIFRQGVRSLAQTRSADVDTLIGTATLAALGLGETLTALVVVWLIDLGDLLETLTIRQSHQAIRDLLAIGDEFAWIVVDGQEVRVPLADVVPGEIVVAHTGDRIPIDGPVVDGQAAVNQAHITGEPLPVVRSAGDRVYAGSIVEHGRIVIRAERVGDETTAGRLLQRIEEARHAQAPIQRLVDRYSRRLVPVSFLFALVVFLLTRQIRRSVTMLVVACPCAAGLSTPTALSAAIGASARRGVLVKGGRYLEAAGKVDAVVFDKTGTLTIGRPVVCKVLTRNGWDCDRLLALAAAAEVHSNHPVAGAIVEAAAHRGLQLPRRYAHKLYVGLGVQASVDGHELLVGGKRLLSRFNVDVDRATHDCAQRMARRERTVLFVAVDGCVAGLLSIQDPVRTGARAAIQRLRAAAVNRLLMITGDGIGAASAVAREVGLGEFRATLLPEEKQSVIELLRAEGRVVAMVGDGVNDAAALALADVGVAMGAGGSDLAIEAADIALAADDIGQVPEVILLGRRTLRTIHQNLMIAIGINGVGVALGATGWLSPLLAAVVHNLSTLVVVANSSSLLNKNRTTPGS